MVRLNTVDSGICGHHVGINDGIMEWSGKACAKLYPLAMLLQWKRSAPTLVFEVQPPSSLRPPRPILGASKCSARIPRSKTALPLPGGQARIQGPSQELRGLGGVGLRVWFRALPFHSVVCRVPLLAGLLVVPSSAQPRLGLNSLVCVSISVSGSSARALPLAPLTSDTAPEPLLCERLGPNWRPSALQPGGLPPS